MSPPPEEMISWVLEELALSGVEGVTISNLFDGVDTHLSSTSQPLASESTKDSLWQSLVARENVAFVDEKKGAILRTLTYQYVLVLDFGDQKLKLRDATPQQDLVQQPIQPSQSPLPAISPTKDVSSVHNSLVSSIENGTPPPAARSSVGPTEATPDSFAQSFQQAKTPTRKQKRRNENTSRTIQRKTDRTWIPKSNVASQEDADRQEDVQEYWAGISRVYIDPPGSARPELPEQVEEQEQRGPSEQSEQPRKKKAKRPEQMIAVFKSLNLMDPEWLRNRMGTWRPAYDARKAELAARETQVFFPAPKPNPKKGKATARAVVASKPSSRKRKARDVFDANPPNGTSEPSRKRAHRRQNSGLTDVSSTTDDATPVLQAVNPVGATHQRIDQSPFHFQPSSMPWQGQPIHQTFPQTVHSQQHPLQPQFFPQHAWRNPAPQQYCQAPQSPFQHQQAQYAHPQDMSPSPAGLQYGVQHELLPLQVQRLAPPPTHIHQQLTTQPTTPKPSTPPSANVQQQTPSQPTEPKRPTPPVMGKPVVTRRRVSQAYIEAAEAAWSKDTCPQLRKECEHLGLPVNGQKQSLVTRLSQAHFELGEHENEEAIQRPTALDAGAQQSAASQSFLTPRQSILAKVTQNASKTYQSPYAASNGPAVKSAPILGERDLEGQSDNATQPAKKMELPMKGRKRRSKSSLEERPQSNKRLTRSGTKDKDLEGTVELGHNQATSEDAAQKTPTISSAQRPIEPQEPVTALNIASCQTSEPLQPVAGQYVASQNESGGAPKFTEHPVADFQQQTTEAPPSAAVAAEQSFVEHFRKSSTPGQQILPTVESSGYGFVRHPIVPQNPFSRSMHYLPPQLPPQTAFPHPHPEGGQGRMHSQHQYTANGMSNVDPRLQSAPGFFAHQNSYTNSPYVSTNFSNSGSQMQSPYLVYAQQSPYQYSSSSVGGQTDFGVHAPFTQVHHAGNSGDPQLQYQAVPPYTGPLQRMQQGIFRDPQLQGPQLGYFSSSSQRPWLPPPVPPSGPSAQPSPIPQNNQSRFSTSSPDRSATPQPRASTAPDYIVEQGAGDQPNIQKPYKSALLVEIEAMEETLERFSSQAQEVVLPENTARLFVSYDNVVGNLVLSKDMTKLMFRALDQEPQEPPILTIKAPQIKDNPNVSMKKSRPMELRVKYEDKDQNEILCRFYFGQTEPAYQSANEMRAAIVRARIICRAAAGQTDTYELFKEDAIPNIEIVKPWLCEICKKRFKNKEGIKYHQEKSNTTCNPKFDPLTMAPRRPKRQNKKSTTKPATKRTAKRATKRAKKVESDEDDDDAGHDDDDGASDSDSNTSSDDSILAWAEKVAFVNPGATLKFAPLTPRKLASKRSTPKLSTEEKVLSQLLEQVINKTLTDETETETIDAAVEDVVQNVIEEVVNFTDVEQRLPATTSGGQSSGIDLHSSDSQDRVTHQRSKDIILSLVDRNFGIFPGDKTLWVAFVVVWFQTHPRSGVLPVSKLCSEAVDQLAQEKALVVTSFPVRENDSMAPLRSILTLPTIEMESPVIGKLKEVIQLAYPGHYLPSRTALSTAILDKLQALTDSPRKPRGHATMAAVQDSEHADGGQDEASVHSHDLMEDFEEYGASDSDYYDDGGRGPKIDESVARKRQGQRLKGRWAAAKAAGSKVLTKSGDYASMDIDSSIGSRSISRSPEKNDSIAASSAQHIGTGLRPSISHFVKPKTNPRASRRVLFPAEEKDKRNVLQANKMLNFAPTSLPNPQTGAWDQSPLRVPFAKPRQKKVRRDRFPEVITYLQSENGAWDTRAYGHGSPPIHSRPARRADGNPTLQSYLKRISQGHRPILWPAENATRVFLPGPPSKHLLRTGKLPCPSRKESKGSESNAPTLEVEDTPLKPKERTRKRKPTTPASDVAEFQPTPKRRRTLLPKPKPQRPSPDTMDPETRPGAMSNSPTKIILRVTRNTQRGGEKVDAIQKIDFFKPRTFIDFEKSPNPGLVSLPVRFWHSNSTALDTGRRSPSIGSSRSSKLNTPAPYFPTPGLKGVEKVAAWEQGAAREMLASGAKTAGLGWINHTVDAMETSFDTETMKLKWDDSATFSIDTLPYEDLEDSEDVEPVEAAPQRKSMSQPPKKRQRTKKGVVLRRRRAIAWPEDFDGVVNIDEVQNKMEVELAPRVQLYTRSLAGMTSQEEARLLMAVIAIMTLTGGVEKSVDFVLLSHVFPHYAANYLKSTWRRISKNRQVLIDTLTPEFQDAFVVAYEAGEVPQIDYDHIIDYDWARVIDWAMKKIYAKGYAKKDVILPQSRKELKKSFDLKEKDDGVDKARESNFNPSSAFYKRMEVIASIPHTLPAHTQSLPISADDIEIDEFTLAKSWVRALCFTPEEDYDKNIAHEKLIDLGDDLVSEVREALIEDKVIRHQNNGRAAPGRPFEPTEVFFAALRTHVTDQQFLQAVAFKKFLDAEFESGKECVRSDYMANEGTVMCVTNLQAYGRITLKAVDVPMKKFGLTDGGYETSKIPKERFRFEMDIYPTSTYLFDEEIPELQEYVDPPRGGEVGEIPLWYGITEDLIPDIWKKVLVAVASTAALRAGASIASLESTFKPALEGWEIWRVMEWGVKAGMVKRIDEDLEGWTMGEWWWAVVGRFCDV